ncbi:MAG: hypothetical protein EPN49_16170 [Rhodanobacter sp.]|nr:MAG: hypothetical protein EPN49_16170 [Rhodanobacter sp.]
MSRTYDDPTDKALRRMVADAHSGRAEQVVAAHLQLVLEAQLAKGIPIAYELDGWVVRENPDGSIDRLKRIGS